MGMGRVLQSWTPQLVIYVRNTGEFGLSRVESRSYKLKITQPGGRKISAGGVSHRTHVKLA